MNLKFAAIVFPLSLSLSSTALADGAAPPTQDWYVIQSATGASIGYASHEVTTDAAGITATDKRVLSLGERIGPQSAVFDTRSPEQELTVSTVISENPEGQVFKIIKIWKLGSYETRTTADISKSSIKITRQTPSGVGNASVAISRDMRFDDGDGLVETMGAQANSHFEFSNFNIDSMAVERVVIEADMEAVSQPGTIALIRKSYRDGELAGIVFLTVDARGQIIEARQPAFHTQIITKRTDRTTALAALMMYRVLPDAMTRAPYLISGEAKSGHVRYQFSFAHGASFHIPQTGEQRVSEKDGEAIVDICSDCGPGMPSGPDALAGALRPTVWLQSDDDRLKEIAAPIARSSLTGTEKMNALLEAAKPYLRKVDFVGHFSALETLDRRSGDCTEAAVLLAALGRAAGIPTKVADGMVYSRESYHGVANTFMPHSWTLAYVDGAWKSFDLALDKFDSTHIALTIGDGDERELSSASQLAGLLQWGAIAEVRKRATTEPAR